MEMKIPEHEQALYGETGTVPPSMLPRNLVERAAALTKIEREMSLEVTKLRKELAKLKSGN